MGYSAPTAGSYDPLGDRDTTMEPKMRVVVKLLKGLLYLAVGLILAVAVLLFGMRFADGPYAIVPGGAFTSGERYAGPEPDWSFVKDRQEIEFQLLDPARSRTTWIVEHEGRIYIPCGYMNSTWGRWWKRWPIEAERDGRAVLRVDGMLYDRQLIRIRHGDALPAVLSEIGRKYLRGAATGSAEEQAQALAMGLERIADGSLWIFELAPRS
ncbi:MAG: hypothetical protein JSU66_05085 [Deltaproteobacteria bacterium]|nr:MAG: hypothetical protein JSU66_05085 [Deltaproteobacteria bacterium]